MRPLTDLVDAIRKLGANYPDAIYEESDGTCSYSQGNVVDGPDQQIGCIVGQAAASIGVPYEVLVDGGEEGSDVFIDRLINEGLIKPDSYDNGKAHWINSVQGSQDGGTEWGEAIRQADTWSGVE